MDRRTRSTGFASLLRAGRIAGQCLAAMLLIALTQAHPATASTAGADGAADDDRGAALFATWCAGCHGSNGDGKGAADPAMVPPPRDFTRGIFKIRTTSARATITLPEILGTISRGLPGSSMPGFGFLPESDRLALARHVLSIAKLPIVDSGTPIPVPPEPPVTADSIAAGKQAYGTLGCPACHGPEGRGDGAAAPFLKDVWGNHTPPPDLHRAIFRGGDAPRELYTRLAVGLPGTPMPSYLDAADSAQIWTVVAYLGSIREPLPTPPSDPAALGEAIVARRQCTACHQLGGKGGHVGPSLDLAAHMLELDWMRRFLVDPTREAKIYLADPYRMPSLGLTAEEAASVTAYLAKLAGRSSTERSAATSPATLPQLIAGQAMFGAKCATCHPLGRVAVGAAQGPDLLGARERLDPGALRRFVYDPKSAGDTSHPAPGLSRADAEAVAAFIAQAPGRRSGRPGPAGG